MGGWLGSTVLPVCGIVFVKVISLRSRPGFGCQPALKSNTFSLVDPSFIACFCKFLWGFPFFFLYFVPLVAEKVVLASKRLILTSKWCAEHPFVGPNTQQLRAVRYESKAVNNLRI